MTTRGTRPRSKCVNCGKRIFMERHGKYGLVAWHHYGYAQRECDGLIAKYATPHTDGSMT